MSKKRNLTFSDAKHKAYYLAQSLATSKVGHTFHFKPKEKMFQIIAVDGCRAMKHVIPQSEIKNNLSSGVEYAEIIISYD